MSREFGSLKDRTAIVTGGASGIGAATVKQFLAAGASVVIGDMNEEAGHSLLAELADAGYQAKVRFQPVDVAQESQVIELVQVAEQEFGGLNILFNNAGIGGAIGPITELDEAHWDHTFAVMTKGVFLGIKHGARAMQKTGSGGSIINTASIAALSGKGGPLAYSATKAAVVNITMNAAVELGEFKIRVNAVCPGIIFTELMHRGREAEAEQVIETIQPSTLRGEPEHIASMVRFLASDDSAFVTGTTQLVDGGYLANGLLGVNPLPGVSNRPNYAGMNHGTTGQDNEIRFLKPKSVKSRDKSSK